jgi:glycosyltransferase involved in cell wall biosynthesis
VRRPVFLLTEQMNLPHGTETLTALAVAGLVRRGHPVCLFTSQFAPRRSAWSEFLAAHGVRVVHPGFWFLTRHHLPHRVCARRLRRLARRVRPALVFALDNAQLCCEALRIWEAGDTPLVAHDPSEASPACPHYERLWFRVCPRVAGLSVHGERQAQSARAYYRIDRPIRAVWPACFSPEGDVPPPRAGEILRFGLFGRQVALKGAVFAVAALHRTLRAGARAELHLFGDGPQAPVVRELVSSLGVEQHVYFRGAYRPADLDRLVAEMDVGLMPSIYEGFGLVMLELMARKRPVIASDVGSAREVLGQLGGGRVVERADTTSLSDAMLHYCREPQAVVRDGRRAHEVWRENFTPDHMMDRCVRFWSSLGIELDG